MNNKRIFKFIFSLTFFLLAILVAIIPWFKNNIDSKVIALIIIGFIPWILKYVKSIEAFGMKAEIFTEKEKNETEKIVLQNEEQINKKLEQVNLENKKKKLLFHKENINPIEQVVNIRIQIEQGLKNMVEAYGMDSSLDIRTNVEKLKSKDLLGDSRIDLIKATLNIINIVLHKGIDSVSEEDFNFAINVGNSTVETIKADIELAEFFPDGIK